nr:ER lumen protein-retaining receptor-like [Ipomoea trifida]
MIFDRKRYDEYIQICRGHDPFGQRPGFASQDPYHQILRRHHKTVRRSYDKQHDTFRHLFLVIPCLLLALVINDKFTFKEVMWTFSIYLEAVAILPQLVLLQRTRNIDNLTGQYVFLLGRFVVDLDLLVTCLLRWLLQLEEQLETRAASLIIEEMVSAILGRASNNC